MISSLENSTIREVRQAAPALSSTIQAIMAQPTTASRR